ncbi:protein LDOC1-like [Pituophis catenifer annectens]|uniref:protein LDOC1-like n=1 Tax=Pituophis catenifer annectens TaxID=94852 RepID=UPI003995F4A2
MEQLCAENAQLTQQVALLAAQVVQLQAHTAPPPRRKCPVPVPDKFDGNQAMFPAFLGQCQLFISLKAEDFLTDRDKVGFMISLLSGAAAHWAMPLLVQASPLLDDFRGFCDHLRLMYKDPIKTQTATRHLETLKQGWHSL